MTSVLESVPQFEAFNDDVRLRQPDAWNRPETKQDRRYLRLVVVLSALASIWYLGWLLQASRIGNPWLFGLLVAAEVFNITQAVGFWWTVAGRSRVSSDDVLNTVPRDTTVDVFIPTYSETIEVVEPTLAMAIEMTGAQTSVWLLDDGDRPEMAVLADRYGAGYVTREEHVGAKAGNINHALAQTSGEFVVILDCDHVPLSHFLERTLPKFADEKVAFVQTPQYYANHRESPIAGASWAQQAIFFGAICEAKNRHDAAFCCGTNVVFRRSALESAGGFPTNSLTEDFELSLRLHEEGWKTRYVSETLACGLGPEDMASYVSQQHRWARGCLSAFPRILRSKLPLRRRMQYLLSSTYFFSGFTVLMYMALPVLNMVFGVAPLSQTTADQFLLHFAPYYALCLYALARAGRGSFSFSAFALFSASFWIQVHACYRWIFRRPSRFVVTPKQGSDCRQPRAVAIPLAMTVILGGSMIYGLAKTQTPGTINNAGFALLHITVLLSGLWPALVKGQGKREATSRLDVIDLDGVVRQPTLSLVED